MNPYKKKLIKLIHVAKSKLAMDDEAYRAMLENMTGKTSSKALGIKDLEWVMDRMRELGFAEQAGKEGPKVRELADDAQSRLIRHHWLRLHELGAVRDPSERALNAFIRRQTKCDRLEWLSTAQASAVIEHLKKWRARLEDAA